MDTALGLQSEPTRDTRATEPSVKPFWDTLLSTERTTRTKDRLNAFEALAELDVLPDCSCKPDKRTQFVEMQVDEERAYVIKMVAEQHYRAALVIARYPDTYVTVRGAIDDALLAAAESDREASEANEAA